MTSNQLKVFVLLVAASWAGGLLVHGHNVPLDYLKAFSYSVTCVTMAFGLWERWLWSWKIFHPWLTTRPDLRGTWKGYVNSDWTDPVTEEGCGQIEAYLVIRQSFSTIDARLLTAESGSLTLSASIIADRERLHTIAVLYENTARMLLRKKSPTGHGAMLLHVRGAPIHQLDGEYWTERETSGELPVSGALQEALCRFCPSTERALQRLALGKVVHYVGRLTGRSG